MDNVDSIFLDRIRKEGILNIVQRCGGKRSTDCSDLDMVLIKNITELVVDPFTHMCNLSFKTSTFTENMKIAKVIPLYNNGDSHVFSNYRPVSLLPHVSKILEKLFLTRFWINSLKNTTP